jgi:hypothetical protein
LQDAKNVCSPAALSRLLAAPQALELLARRRVEAVADAAAGARLLVIDVLDRLESREKRTRGDLAYLLPGCPAHSVIGRDDAHELGLPVLCRETLEEIVGMRSEPHLERADRGVLPVPVEYQHPTGAAQPDEACEHVGELAAICKPARMEEI